MRTSSLPLRSESFGSEESSGNNIFQMYDALHTMLNRCCHIWLEPIKLPDPLPNMKSMNVISYDLSLSYPPFCKRKKMTAGNNLVLDPNSPLVMYKPVTLLDGDA
jgi:hypothetical protein